MTSIQELFGVELPVIQAPMASACGADMAAAVCNAGGLGSLPCAMLDLEGIKKDLERLTAATSKPFNVNFFCHAPPPAAPERHAAWAARLKPYYAELGVDAPPLGSSPSAMREPFDEATADVIEPFRPPVVSFHFGLPSESLVRRVRSWGAKVISSATTVEEAVWLEKHGADAIIAQGVEAGGHRGMFLTEDITTQVGTLALVPQICAAVRVPVIAAGGIADARGVAAALSLGAVAAQVGTAYLLCPESIISPLHRAALASPGARHTALTNVLSGRPARGIVNRAMRELGPIAADAPPFPTAWAHLALLRGPAEAAGSTDFSALWSGQNASGCREVPAAQVTRELASLVTSAKV